MTAPVAGANVNGAFHLRFDAEEDRLLVSVDVAEDRQFAVALTRRMLRHLLAALADLEARRLGSIAPGDRGRRDAMLGFEHESAVTAALASGETRRNEPQHPLVAPPRLVREIKLTPKNDGGVVLALDDGGKTMTIDLDLGRVHSAMAALLEVAAFAEWDLPRVATWLERASPAAAPTAGPRVLH